MKEIKRFLTDYLETCLSENYREYIMRDIDRLYRTEILIDLKCSLNPYFTRKEQNDYIKKCIEKWEI